MLAADCHALLMNSGDANNWLIALTFALVGLTALVTYFAGRTVNESKKATAAMDRAADKTAEAAVEAGKTVDALKGLAGAVGELLATSRQASEFAQQSVVAAQNTVSAARDLVVAARETIEVARAAHATDDLERKVVQLRDIGSLAETIFWKGYAQAENPPVPHGWRLMEQNYLQQALVGLTEELPKCAELAGVHSPDAAVGAGRDARDEVSLALKRLRGEM